MSIPLDELRAVRKAAESNRCTKCGDPLPSLLRKVCPACLFKTEPAAPWPYEVPKGRCPRCSRRVLVRKTTGKIGRHTLGAGHHCRGEGLDPVSKRC